MCVCGGEGCWSGGYMRILAFINGNPCVGVSVQVVNFYNVYQYRFPLAIFEYTI